MCFELIGQQSFVRQRSLADGRRELVVLNALIWRQGSGSLAQRPMPGDAVPPVLAAALRQDEFTAGK